MMTATRPIILRLKQAPADERRDFIAYLCDADEQTVATTLWTSPIIRSITIGDVLTIAATIKEEE